MALFALLAVLAVAALWLVPCASSPGPSLDAELPEHCTCASGQACLERGRSYTMSSMILRASVERGAQGNLYRAWRAQRKAQACFVRAKAQPESRRAEAKAEALHRELVALRGRLSQALQRAEVSGDEEAIARARLALERAFPPAARRTP